MKTGKSNMRPSKKKVSKKKDDVKINKVELLDEDENVINEEEEELSDEDILLKKNEKVEEIIEIDKKSKEYWTESTEKAVIEYLNLDPYYLRSQLEDYINSKAKLKEEDEDYINILKERLRLAELPEATHLKQQIFRKKIQKPLNKLIENIIFNFKLFRNGVDVKSLHQDCVSFVYSKFANFNPEKNTKSFSFFGTIAKHYLLGEKKDLDKSNKLNLDYDDFRQDVDEVKTYKIDEASELDKSHTLFSHVVAEIEKEIKKENLSENDIKVGDAIIQVFKNHDIIGVYNKNQIYQLIKENTGLQTKDITYSLHRFRIFYRLTKQTFLRKTDTGEEDIDNFFK